MLLRIIAQRPVASRKWQALLERQPLDPGLKLPRRVARILAQLERTVTTTTRIRITGRRRIPTPNKAASPSAIAAVQPIR